MKKKILSGLIALVALALGSSAWAAIPDGDGITGDSPGIVLSQSTKANLTSIAGITYVAPVTLASAMGTKGESPQSSVLTAKAPSTILGTGSSMVLADKLPTPYPAIASTHQSIGVGGVMASVIGGATWNSDLMAKGDYIGFDIGGGVRRNSTAIMTAQAPQKPAGNCGSCHSKKPATGGFASVSPPGLVLAA